MNKTNRSMCRGFAKRDLRRHTAFLTSGPYTVFGGGKRGPYGRQNTKLGAPRGWTCLSASPDGGMVHTPTKRGRLLLSTRGATGENGIVNILEIT